MCYPLFKYSSVDPFISFCDQDVPACAGLGCQLSVVIGQEFGIHEEGIKQIDGD